jgi:penicillin-binding protein 1A
MKKIIKKIKKIWNNDCRDILVPIISIIIFVVALLSIGALKALIIFFLINGIYFGISFFTKKKGKKNKSKKKKKNIFKVLLLILLTLFILGIMAIVSFFIYIVVKAPEFDEKNLYVSSPSIILNKDGEEITKLGEQKRVIINYDEIPEVLVDAIVATEDSRFFEHKGVDWARFLKASVYQVLGRSEAGGASTLTMQVSKNAYTNSEDEGIEGIIRKFTDLYVAMFVIEKNYTKEQIMEFYVNSHWLAKHTYGVEQTALTYFGKSAKDLNLAEAAMIAGLFQAPGRYDPYRNPEATEARRQTVLKLMLRHGYISKNEYDIAKKMTVEKIVIPQEQSSYASGEVSKYQSFIDTVVDEVKEKTGKNPYSTPMIIYTTLDTDVQDYLNDIMNGETYDWENDVVQAGVAIINVKDGSVTAIGGGRNVNVIDSLNYATELTNQIGSTAKPLYDYGPAIEYNNWSPAQIIVDEPTTYSDGTPINNWNRSFEGVETMRVALKGSRNIPALKTFKKNNKAQIIEFVTNLGLTPEIYTCPDGYKRDKKTCINKENPNDIIEANKANTLHEAHAIGGYNGESPLTMAAAYAAFANGGIYTEPYTFTKIVYQETGEEFINDIKKTKAMSEETAYIVSDMLVTTAPSAVGRNINGIKYAAKTGTTNYNDKTMKDNKLPSNAVNDLWTVGFNTEYAIGVWYGYDKIYSDHYNVLSSGQHNRLFAAVGKKVFTNGAAFTKPSGVISVEIETGCPEPTLPSEFTPSEFREKELFIKGTEPTQVSTRFAKLSDVTNLKANVNNDKITLTWDKVKTPDMNTESYLKEYYKSMFENESYLNDYVAKVLSDNKSILGDIQYNIYLKDTNGNLSLISNTSSNTFETTVDVSSEYTYVVKAVYSNLKENISDGKEVKVNVSISSPIIPTPDEPINDLNNNQGEEQNIQP